MKFLRNIKEKIRRDRFMHEVFTKDGVQNFIIELEERQLQWFCYRKHKIGTTDTVKVINNIV
jgi:hypothetical protein